MISVSQAICTYMDKNKDLKDMCVAVAATLNLCCCTQRDSSCGSEQHFHTVNTQFLICAINNTRKMEACLCIPFMDFYSINHKGSPHFYSSVRKGLIYHSLWMDAESKRWHPCITPGLPGSYHRHLMVITRVGQRHMQRHRTFVPESQGSLLAGLGTGGSVSLQHSSSPSPLLFVHPQTAGMQM